jgi:hypothetical protein
MKLHKITKKVINAKFVLCHWLDINSDASWMSLEKAKASTPTICVSTGWLIRADKNVHVLVADINFEDDGTLADVGNVTVIPTMNVIKKKVLKI